MKRLLIAILIVSLNSIYFASPARAEVTVSHYLGIGGMGDSDGDSKTASFNKPSDVTVDSNGNSYVVDVNGIRKIDSSGKVSTLFKPSAGQNSASYCGITLDKERNIWFGDCRRSIVYKVSNSGTLLRTINLPNPQNSWMSLTPGIDALPDGSILISVWLEGKILKVSPEGNISVYYQSKVSGNCNVYPRPLGIICPTALTVSPNGEVYIVNQGAVGAEILKIDSNGNSTKINGPVNPNNVEFTNGALYVSAGDSSTEQNLQIYRIENSGSQQVVYRKYDANRWSANGFKFIDAGNLIITSYENNVVRKINISSGNQTIIGNAKYGTDDGNLKDASTQYPSGITEDSQGNLYFMDFKGIRKISKDGIVSTLYKTLYNNTSGVIFKNQKLHFIESNLIKTIDLNGNLLASTNLSIAGDYTIGGNNSFAVTSSGQFYVVMYRSNDNSTRYIRKFETSGTFKDISISTQQYVDLRIVVDNEDSLIVASNGQIRKYKNDDASNSTYVSSFSGYNQNIAVSSTGDLYIFSRDQYSSILNVVKKNGLIENIINGQAESSINAGVKSGFSAVSGLLISSSDQIYVSDSSNNAIRLIKTSTSANPGPTTITENLRKARNNSSWSRPSDLLAGLSEVRYKGYFNDDPTFFNDDVTKRSSVSKTASNQLPNWYDSTVMGQNISIYWGGYFIPDETGTWDFQVTSDDSSLMWIGNEAVSKYWNGYSNALIALPGSHGPQTKSASITLEANKIYPLRIFYGNLGGPAGSFKLEIKAPSFKSKWDTNLEGLIWHSDFSNTEDCTNYGISYLLSAKLGYDIVDVNACKNNPAKLFNNKYLPTKPSTPSLNKLSINGNTINLTVNIGSANNKPDKVFILVPQLGINANSPNSAGKISGSTATWSIPITKSANGKSADIQVISSKEGEQSEPLKKTVKIPAAPKVPTVVKVPVKPAPTIKTVICKKGTQTRTFAGKSCPPGWN